MVKTYAHFCFDTLVSFKMGGRGRKLVGKEGREPAGQGKDCGRGRSAEEVRRGRRSKPQAEPGRSVLTRVLPELF